MDTVLILARLLLAGVFFVTAAAKLADMSGSRRALEGFAVPRRLVPAGAVAIPAAELLAAGLLIPVATARLGALLALMLLLAFMLGIVAALRRGQAPDCHCFGQLHSRPAGRETVVRNVVLAVATMFVLIAGPGQSLRSWAAESDGTLVALAGTSLIGIVLAYACWSLWRENRRLTGRHGQAEELTPLEVGTPAPEFSVSDLSGGTRTSSDVLGQERSILVFVSSSCGPCVGLLPELARWRHMLAGRLAIHVVAAGDESENRRLADEHDVPMLLDRGSRAAAAFGVSATPSAVELDESRTVASYPAAGGPAIEGLIRAALRRPRAAAVSLSVQHVPAHASPPASGPSV